MLVAGKAEKGKDDVDRFTMVIIMKVAKVREVEQKKYSQSHYCFTSDMICHGLDFVQFVE